MNGQPKRSLVYRDLLVWIKARDLAARTLILSDNGLLRRSRSLCDQLQRSSLSVPSNIAEGEERGTNKEALRFLFIAKGSLAEFRTQLEVGNVAGLIPKEEFEKLESEADHIARLLSGLIKSRLEREKRANTQSST
jgi:four helix bundle protein